MNPIIGFTFVFVIVIVAVGVVLHYRHKKAELIHTERMAAMEKGVALPVFEPATRSLDPLRRNLLFGMIWLFSGAGLAVFLFALSTTTNRSPMDSIGERQATVEAMRALGASESELREVFMQRSRERPVIPIGLGAIGFVPMGVGLAYLIFYAVERKRYSVTA